MIERRFVPYHYTAADMLDHLKKFIVMAMRNGDVCAAARAAEEMNRIENICGVLAEKEGLNDEHTRCNRTD